MSICPSPRPGASRRSLPSCSFVLPESLNTWLVFAGSAVHLPVFSLCPLGQSHAKFPACWNRKHRQDWKSIYNREVEPLGRVFDVELLGVGVLDICVLVEGLLVIHSGMWLSAVSSSTVSTSPVRLVVFPHGVRAASTLGPLKPLVLS